MDPNILPPDENITEKQLKFGYWFVTHKLVLRKWFTFALMVVGALLCLFAVGMLVKLYLIDYSGYLKLQQELPVSLVNPAAVQAELPRQLDVKPVTVLQGTNGAQDLMVTVTNPNASWWATWDGRFAAGASSSTAKREYILPGETKEFLDLGEESVAGFAGAKYGISGLVWNKVDKHVIPDYSAYYGERFRFDVSNVAFTSEKSPDGANVVSRASFDVTNNSAYSYWTVKFLVNLYRGDTIVAANSAELSQLETGETRHVDMVWVQDLPAISKVEVIPQVNVLDPNAYMPQKGSAGQ